MFDFAFGKLFIIIIIALLVLGPQKTIILSKNLGQWISKAQKFIAGARLQFKQIQDDIESNTKLEEINNLKKELLETKKQIQDELEQINHNANQNLTINEQPAESNEDLNHKNDPISETFLSNKKNIQKKHLQKPQPFSVNDLDALPNPMELLHGCAKRFKTKRTSIRIQEKQIIQKINKRKL